MSKLLCVALFSAATGFNLQGGKSLRPVLRLGPGSAKGALAGVVALHLFAAPFAPPAWAVLGEATIADEIRAPSPEFKPPELPKIDTTKAREAAAAAAVSASASASAVASAASATALNSAAALSKFDARAAAEAVTKVDPRTAAASTSAAVSAASAAASSSAAAAASAAADSLKNAKMPNVKVPDVVPERLKQENIPSSVDPTKGTFSI